MSLACVLSRACLGLASPVVRVEVHLSCGLPGLTLVGLPETGVRESKDRVRSALLNSGFSFPQQRITINLAPADLPKEGGRFDLPIALGILAASGQLPEQALAGHVCLGELALSGAVQGVTGTLSASLACRDQAQTLIAPAENRDEALLPSGARVVSAETLAGLVAQLRTGKVALASPGVARPAEEVAPAQAQPDLAQVRGQLLARRALEVAAAGGHSLLLSGPPGAGKTLLASCLPGLLPALLPEQQLEVAAIHSLSGQARPLHTLPPWRAPHHRSSAAALIGGGSGLPRPGEISLAHHGVLFLDELPEFHRDVLECLREPLECGVIRLARARHRVSYPARFQLVAAMNPCPCGLAGQAGACRCTPEQQARYRQRLSAPLMDRIDLRIAVPPVPLSALTASSDAPEPSARVRERVQRARNLQLARDGRLNADHDGQALLHALDKAGRDWLSRAGEQHGLSARACHRVLRVARTLADLAEATAIRRQDLSEAMMFRNAG